MTQLSVKMEQKHVHENVTELSDGTFEQQVLQSDKPVLVDFTAEWCPPCKLLNPIIARLAKEYADKAIIGTMDAETNREVMIKYKVNALPTVIVFRNGVATHQFRGLRPEQDYRAALDVS